MKAFDEGNRDASGKEAELLQSNEREGNEQGDNDLPEELGACGKAEVAALDDLDVVVGKADGSKGDGREHDQPDEPVR